MSDFQCHLHVMFKILPLYQNLLSYLGEFSTDIKDFINHCNNKVSISFHIYLYVLIIN